MVRSAVAANTDVFLMRFNADNAAHYQNLGITVNDGSVISIVSGQTSFIGFGALFVGGSLTADEFSPVTIDIMNYTDTAFWKSANLVIGLDDATEVIATHSTLSGTWQSTAAITSIVFQGTGASLDTGSTLSLYGING